MPVLSIVVPVYYNEGSLPALHDRLQALETRLATKRVQLELIFVDDGSGDQSYAALQAIKARRPATRLVKLSRNFGVISALKAGFAQVTGDACVTLAADLQDPPEVVDEMVDAWLAGAKFVICERASRDDPLFSRLYSALYYRLVRGMVISDYPNGGFDLSLMDKALLPYLIDSAKSTYTPLLAYWLGYKPTVIKYHREPRAHGKSRWTFGKKLNACMDVIIGFSATPIRMMSMLGAMVAMLSFAYGASVVLWALLVERTMPGFTTLVALVTFLLGLILLMLGVIGEYLWRMWAELNRRPDAVIERIE